MPIEYILYFPIVILVFIFLLPKAKNKIFIGLFLLWMFGSPILLNPRYTISVSVFGFDLQPNRLMFLILTLTFFFNFLRPQRFSNKTKPSERTRIRPFEVFLIVYVLLVAFVVFLNQNSIGMRIAIADATNSFTFVLLYFCTKKYMSYVDFDLLKKAVLILAAISAVVGLYQFFVNPNFFRLGDTRAAFSGFARANGIMTQEYDQGFFLAISVILCMSMSLKWWIKIGFFGLISAGVFVTMHRLSWLALTFVIGMIWFLYWRKNFAITFVVISILMLVGLVAINISWPNGSLGQFSMDFISQRLLADTLTIRFSQYDFAFSVFRAYPLGIGGYWTSLYNQLAYTHGMLLVSQRALVVHNGFLSAGVKYGIAGLFAFSLFVLTSIFYFFKASLRYGKQWYPPLLICTVFMIFNLTNDFSFIGTEVSMYLAVTVSAFAAINYQPANVEMNEYSILQNPIGDKATQYGN